MIKYELAKKLKEAGFPQKNHEMKCSCCWFEWYDEDSEDHELWNSNEIELSENYVYVPTLSELIEACGDDFGGLERRSDVMFVAIEYFEKGNIYFVEKTPEEAVAKLWLELNNK